MATPVYQNHKVFVAESDVATSKVTDESDLATSKMYNDREVATSKVTDDFMATLLTCDYKPPLNVDPLDHVDESDVKTSKAINESQVSTSKVINEGEVATSKVTNDYIPPLNVGSLAESDVATSKATNESEITTLKITNKSEVTISKLNVKSEGVTSKATDDFMATLLTCNYKPSLQVDPSVDVAESDVTTSKVNNESEVATLKVTNEVATSKVTNDFMATLLTCDYIPPLNVDPLETQKNEEKFLPKSSHSKEIIKENIMEPNHSEEIITGDIMEPEHSDEITEVDILEPNSETEHQVADEKDTLVHEEIHELKPNNPEGWHPKPKTNQFQSQGKQVQRKDKKDECKQVQGEAQTQSEQIQGEFHPQGERILRELHFHGEQIQREFQQLQVGPFNQPQINFGFPMWQQNGILFPPHQNGILFPPHQNFLQFVQAGFEHFVQHVCRPLVQQFNCVPPPKPLVLLRGNHDIRKNLPSNARKLNMDANQLQMYGPNVDMYETETETYIADRNWREEIPIGVAENIQQFPNSLSQEAAINTTKFEATSSAVSADSDTQKSPNRRTRQFITDEHKEILLRAFKLNQKPSRETRCQFHQHFMSSFCAYIILPKKSQSQTVIREKLRKPISTQRHA